MCFIIDKGLLCYKVMPLGLKNEGVTYQRLVNKMLQDLLGMMMEVYINDMDVKDKLRVDHISHLFQILRKYNLKFNPSKCSFGVSSGQFLGHVVSKRGIESNPMKISQLIWVYLFITRKDV